MKLQIKKKYFDDIKAGNKAIEYRDAHITFICEETGEQLRKNVYAVAIRRKPNGMDDVLQDMNSIAFYLSEPSGKRK